MRAAGPKHAGGAGESIIFAAWRPGLALVVAALAGAAAQAVERHVPGEYPTIQAAVDACVDGDVVVVADGIYSGAGNTEVNFGGRAITVRSANGPAACIIDGSGNARKAFDFLTDEGPESVVDGFTVRNMRPG